MTNACSVSFAPAKVRLNQTLQDRAPVAKHHTCKRNFFCACTKKADLMMYPFYLILGLASAALSFTGLYFLNRFSKKNALWQKIFALALFILFFIRYFGASFKEAIYHGSVMLVKDRIMATIALVVNSPFGEGKAFLTAFSVLLVWANFSALTLLVTYPFFKDKVKILNGIVKLLP